MFEYIVKAVFSLIIVGLLIYGTYIASKHLRKVALNDKSNKYIKIIERVTLGQDKAIAIAKVNDKHYLIGISQNSINLLTQLDEFSEITEQENDCNKSFMDYLMINLKGSVGSFGIKGAKKDE